MFITWSLLYTCKAPSKEPKYSGLSPVVIDFDLCNDLFHPDFLEDYPDAHKDVVDEFPLPHGMVITSHDTITSTIESTCNSTYEYKVTS